jgi:HAMP domain-containing protein
MCTGNGTAPGSVAEALRMAHASLDYLNGRGAADLEAASCGGVLSALGEVQAKFTAAHASVLARFDGASAHDSDGYGTSRSWLTAMAKMRGKDAAAAVRLMRALRRHRPLAQALAAGEISASWAGQILDWIAKLPAQLRDDTEAVAGLVEILVRAAAAGAILEDLEAILARAKALWQAGHPDADQDDQFEERYFQVASTFDGAGVARGDLTPECAAAVQAVLEALGKKAGPEDARTEGQRFHDALQAGCELLIRAKMVPDRAGADTQVLVHIPISQLRDMPGAPEIEDAFLGALLGEPGFLAGKDAEAAACDALTIPVVTGHADMTVIDKMIELALAAHGSTHGSDHGTSDDRADNAGAPDGTGSKPRPMSREAWQALRYTIARLAIDFVSGPDGIASALRTGLLKAPFNTPSQPLDIGHSDTIPAAIRRAVTLRDRHCAWPGCDTPAAACDVHHLTHQKDGGPTSVTGTGLYCQFHHDIAIHRWGWQVIRHPDGTSEARSPDGHLILHSHAPPTRQAG